MAITKDAFVASLPRASRRRGGGAALSPLVPCSAALPADLRSIRSWRCPSRPRSRRVSGKRELHNARAGISTLRTRQVSVCEGSARPSRKARDRQDRRHFGSKLGVTYLRVPSMGRTPTASGSSAHRPRRQMFTMLLYMSRDAQHRTLGHRHLRPGQKHVGSSPFAPNAAMVFVPSGTTTTASRPARSTACAKSVIINYVTNEWRAPSSWRFRTGRFEGVRPSRLPLHLSYVDARGLTPYRRV